MIVKDTPLNLLQTHLKMQNKLRAFTWTFPESRFFPKCVTCCGWHSKRSQWTFFQTWNTPLFFFSNSRKQSFISHRGLDHFKDASPSLSSMSWQLTHLGSGQAQSPSSVWQHKWLYGPHSKWHLQKLCSDLTGWEQPEFSANDSIAVFDPVREMHYLLLICLLLSLLEQVDRLMFS